MTGCSQGVVCRAHADALSDAINAASILPLRVAIRSCDLILVL